MFGVVETNRAESSVRKARGKLRVTLRKALEGAVVAGVALGIAYKSERSIRAMVFGMTGLALGIGSAGAMGKTLVMLPVLNGLIIWLAEAVTAQTLMRHLSWLESSGKPM